MANANACDVARKQLAKEISDLKHTSPADKAVNTLRLMLLSNPASHVTNITGNLTRAALLAADDAQAAILDTIISAASGKPRVVAAPSLKAYGQGLAKGTREGIGIVRGTHAEAASKYEGGGVHYDNVFFEGLNKLVFKSLSAEDHAAWTAANTQAIHQLAKVEAANAKGGQALVDRLVKAPTDEMILEAAKRADIATFKNRNQVAEFLEKGRGGLKGTETRGREARRLLKKGGTRNERRTSELAEQVNQGQNAAVARGISEIVAPFSKVPTNVAASRLAYTPVGLLYSLAKQIGNPDKAEALRAFARMGTGGALVGAGWILAEHGLATGPVSAGLEGQGERQQLGMAGAVENGVKIGDTWADVSRFAPGGSLIALGAHLYTVAKEGKQSPFLSGVLQPMAGSLQDTYLGDISDTAENVSTMFRGNPERGLGQEVGQRLSSMVIPNVVGASSRGMDPYERVSKGEGFGDALINQFKMKTPLRMGLPARMNALGEPEERGQGVLGSLFSPTRYKRGGDHDQERIAEELAKVGVHLGIPGANVTNPETGVEQKLSVTQRNFYNGRVGKAIKESLLSVIDDPAYLTSTPAEQAEQLKEAIKSARKEAGKQAISDALGIR